MFSTFRYALFVGTRFDNNQTKLLNRRLRRWHDASCPSSFENPALLGLLGFSGWQLVQVLVEACHLVSSQAALRHLQLVRVPDRMVYPTPRASSCRSPDLVPGTIFLFSW